MSDRLVRTETHGGLAVSLVPLHEVLQMHHLRCYELLAADKPKRLLTRIACQQNCNHAPTRAGDTI
jgi:hypothetical protein